MQRVFISNLDLAPGRACAHVFRCFGYEVYGTVQDDDFAQPAPAEAHKIVAPPTKNLQAFTESILSCSVIIYDLNKPSEAVTAMEICAQAHNQRKFLTISTFMTWARTELPPQQDDENAEAIDENELPDEKAMEVNEVIQLYKAAKMPPPQWAIQKLEDIKRKEKEEREAEIAAARKAAQDAGEEYKEPPPEVEAEPEAEKAPEQQDEGEVKEGEAEDEALEEEEVVDPEEALLKLPTYGLQETEFAQRRPHPDYRPQYEAENQLVQILQKSQNITGAILVPGVIYGHGETQLTWLYKRFYLQEETQAPLYYGGQSRVLPFVHALDLALLAHALTVEACPDKSQPFIFAVERQQVTARQFSETLGMKVLAEDPKREKIVQELAEAALKVKPVPLTKQTYRVWKANMNRPRPLPSYVRQVSKNETLLNNNSVKELTVNAPMQPGYSCRDVLEGKWPLFCREGVLGNIELSWSEYLAVWGLEPVRVLIQTGPDVQRTLGLELGEAIARYIKERDESKLQYMFEEVGRSRISNPSGNLLIVDCADMTAKDLIKELTLKKSTREKGWVLINLPAGAAPEDIFGKQVVTNMYEFYADTGIKPPKKKKLKEKEEEDKPEEEKPEWLAEDVNIDPEERIKLIRAHILLPYTAPRNLFSTASIQGKMKLATPALPKIDFLDANITLEHPLGLRVPKPQYIFEMPRMYRYEQDIDQKLFAAFKAMDKISLDLFRKREYEKQLEERKQYILKTKQQIIKNINKKAAAGNGTEYDEETFNWTDNYSLLGLDPLLDLKQLKIPKKAGLPDEVEAEPELDEEGNPKPVAVKQINPDDYELGIEDLSIYTQRQADQAQRRAARRQRNSDRTRRKNEGAEEVSDNEEEKSEEQMDEAGNPVRMVPKPRPFANAPKVMKKEQIAEPREHKTGYVWRLEMMSIGRILGLEGQRFTDCCALAVRFIGKPRVYPASRLERVVIEQRAKLEKEIHRRIQEEKLMKAQEEKRIAEEKRILELKALKEKYEKDEERRVVELAIPLRKYIGGTVLQDLMDGLVEVTRIRPADPVRYLGEFLMDRSVK